MYLPSNRLVYKVLPQSMVMEFLIFTQGNPILPHPTGYSFIKKHPLCRGIIIYYRRKCSKMEDLGGTKKKEGKVAWR